MFVWKWNGTKHMCTSLLKIEKELKCVPKMQFPPKIKKKLISGDYTIVWNPSICMFFCLINLD